MKTSKKLLLTAGICFQMSAMLFADAWSDAFNAFGGAQQVYDRRASYSYSDCLKVAESLGNTPEALAVGQFMSAGLEINLKKRFNGAATRQNVIDALNQALQPVRSVPVAQPAPVVDKTPVRRPVEQAAPVAQQGGWSSWLSGSAQQAAPALSSADLQKAVQAQQDADAAAAAASNQALANLVNSGATGLNLYKGYIDLIFNLLQQAVNAIVDPVVQQQVIGYAQNKLASMKASAAAANQYNSRTLGRMSSKKIAKKLSNKKA